jgi:hypothetical protein
MPCASDLPGSLSRTFVRAVERKENETLVFSVRVLSEPVAVRSLGDATLLVSGQPPAQVNPQWSGEGPVFSQAEVQGAFARS